MKHLSNYPQFSLSESQKMAGDLFVTPEEGAEMINEFVGELYSDPEVIAALEKVREIIRKKMQEDPAISLLGEDHFETFHDRTRDYWAEDPPSDLDDLNAGWLFIESTVLNIPN